LRDIPIVERRHGGGNRHRSYLVVEAAKFPHETGVEHGPGARDIKRAFPARHDRRRHRDSDDGVPRDHATERPAQHELHRYEVDAVGNPLFDIVALSHVETVVKDGVVWKKDGAFVDASKRRGTSQD
jgi:hypothetical protein